MNPRQRRGVLLIATAALGALVVFFGVLSYVGEVSASVGDMRPVLSLKRAVKAYEPLRPEHVQVVELPAKWAPATALTDPSQVVGFVAASDLPQGSTLQRGMIRDRPGIRPGSREIAILVDARTGVGGKIRPGDRVDVFATWETKQDARRAEVIVTDALVIDVGVPSEARNNDRRSDSFGDAEQAVPVTFALPVRDALRVSFAESFATEVRLALRGGGDTSTISPRERVYTDSVQAVRP